MQLSVAEFKALLTHLDPDSDLAEKLRTNIMRAIGGEQARATMQEMATRAVMEAISSAFADTKYWKGVATKEILNHVKEQLKTWDPKDAVRRIVEEVQGDVIRSIVLQEFGKVMEAKADDLARRFEHKMDAKLNAAPRVRLAKLLAD